MVADARSGATLLAECLHRAGIEVVFGLPGTQTVPLYDAIRRSRLRAIVTSHELAATFMAIGYYRASGRLAAVSTIPGPGFTYALTALAEARHDSAALLLIVVKPTPSRARRFRFQDIDHEALARPVAKGFVRVTDAGDIPARVGEALALAMLGEPGPVVLEIAAAALEELIADAAPLPPLPPRPALTSEALDLLDSVLGRARRPVLLAGGGCVDAPREVTALAERLGALVLTTSSGRGVIPEDHPLALAYEYSLHDVGVVNDLFAASDLVLGLGCKLAHNGAAGFRLQIPEDRFVHVDASGEVLDGTYPARHAFIADLPTALRQLLSRVGAAVATGWDASARDEWRARCVRAAARWPSETPGIHGGLVRVLDTLRRAAGSDACLVTDSGHHQMVSRSTWRVMRPRTLIAPADFQSMGFGLAAALGAKLAAPDRPVIAVIGDGGFRMAGLELATAVRERIPVMVVLCADGGFGLIRRQQLQDSFPAFAVDIGEVDHLALARALGAFAARAVEPLETCLATFVTGSGVGLMEVKVQDPPAFRSARRRRDVRAALERWFGTSRTNRLRGLLGRVRPRR